MQICGYGGIGRHAGFRFLWATVQVQALLPAPKNACPKAGVFCCSNIFKLFIYYTILYASFIIKSVFCMFIICLFNVHKLPIINTSYFTYAP